MSASTSQHGWQISDNESDSDDSVSLLSSSVQQKPKLLNKSKDLLFASPSQIRKKQVPKKEIEDCPFGERCYRKNPNHLQEFRHPNKRETDGDDIDYFEIPAKRQKVANESRDPQIIWHHSSPLNFLLTTVSGLPDKFNYFHEETPLSSIHIKDILSKEFGDLLETVQFNYCIDARWFMEQLPSDKQQLPVLFVHGEQGADYSDINRSDYPNLKTCRVELPPFGTHHTKMMFLRYKEGIRVIIHTSNLRKSDWHQKTQGMWISPLFPPKGESGTDSKTAFSFKHDLMEYLNHYKKHQDLVRWMNLIKEHDLSSAKIILIGSVPGRHKDTALHKWGHLKLARALSAHCEQSQISGWTVIGQFSSVGSLGASKDKWLCKEWLKSMSATKMKKFGALSYSTNKSTPLKLIFPTVENVRMSLEGYPAGGSIPYSCSVAKKQIWFNNFLHQWKSKYLVRTQASPHIKTYTRVNKDYSKAAWFLLTSANMSKAAWGVLEKKDSQLAIKSYELGVLFLPQVLSRFRKTAFDLKSEGDTRPDLTLPYSTPLLPYSENDEPWIWDIPHKHLPDGHGNMWVPS